MSLLDPVEKGPLEITLPVALINVSGEIPAVTSLMSNMLLPM